MFDIYKNKKVLVTGHTGFKGSWLTEWLLELGSDVIGYALNPISEKDNFVLANLINKIKDYREDIRNYSKLYEVVQREEPEIIFHLAAQPLVLESYKNPHYTFETNTLGTANILEAFRQADKARVLVVITTDKVYQNNEWEWGYRENDSLGANDPYSASKAASELIITSYLKSLIDIKEKLIVSVRAGNVIGGGDWADDRILPDCIRALEKNEDIIIRNPKSTRPWQHVLEPLGGYLLLGEKLLNNKTEFMGAWNFGPYLSNVISVEELVNFVIEYYGEGKYTIQSLENSFKESNFLSLDITKAIKKLNWKPILNINETIELTVDWYKRYKKENVDKICKEQITAYMKLWKLNG